MSFTNQSKHSASFSDVSKHSVSIGSLNKFIHPWKYEEATFTYDMSVTADAFMLPISYESVGSESFSNTSKHSASISSSNKFIHPWKYEESGFAYDQVASTDGFSLPIYYESVGRELFTNTQKS